MEERFKLIPKDRDKAVCVISLIILLPADADLVPKKRCNKRNFVSSRSPSGSEIVLKLLTEVITVYVRLYAIYIWRTGLQWPIS